ncbi:phage portal protein [Gracilibacillus salinarum]|uniref:Phage portal protein n=1 Tax=Gracilibacillus salinarum TaxID=2932255 RepID=A0ABY4GT56_9BACI|nr:phage portal protein [Gracilibacillus salinarum]UOQ87396.1 phage portal protein [Gracilibacillus salinarum]
MHDQGLIEDISERIHMKKLAIQICVNLIGRTISQSEFRVKDGEKLIKTELYYRLNVRPNKNMSASQFWQTVIYKLIHDNECLIIKSDSDDLLIADDFYRDEYGLVEDIFKSVTIKNFTYSRTFRMSDVIYLEYDNENLSKLLSSLYSDYGELFGRLIEYQKLNYQVRSTVDTEDVHSKDPKKRAKMQKFINDMYASIRSKVFAIVPQQKGFKYEEHAKTNNSGNTIDDINKITNGYLDQVSKALGIPPSLVHGEMADVEKHTRNFMTFCIDSLLKKIKDEFDGKFFSKQEYLSGQRMDIRRVTYRNMFDVATAVDKLRSSGVANGHELRDELGMEESDDPIHDKYVITKNYSETVEGGEN